MAIALEQCVDEALRLGFLTPALEAGVNRICEQATALSELQQLALRRLIGALRSGEVIVMPRQQLFNLMEELVFSEAIAQVSAFELREDVTLDLPAIVVHALNRLPPLYASSLEQAQSVRQLGLEQYQTLIAARVSEAISLGFGLRSSASSSRDNLERQPLLLQVAPLLQMLAPDD
ncbi:late competence development ComFB family protein [Synechococcus elongatus]|uniref:Late competence development ComFB family protein n=2 Tax=Synechococcus elongatus TaxID=32046 RepID=A0AAN1QP67_SYNEL|nr:late competence development ComFB family protein [Synechococcus elongatus]AZB72816.1 hypothetical protein DOP62_08905 [Synechococcus elongatus PCC 11801]QFZ92543.1 hypothetical protein EKO22_09485 [Synechococcus elongatus PCC 11802]